MSPSERALLPFVTRFLSAPRACLTFAFVFAPPPPHSAPVAVIHRRCRTLPPLPRRSSPLPRPRHDSGSPCHSSPSTPSPSAGHSVYSAVLPPFPLSVSRLPCAPAALRQRASAPPLSPFRSNAHPLVPPRISACRRRFARPPRPLAQRRPPSAPLSPLFAPSQPLLSPPQRHLDVVFLLPSVA